MRNRNVGMIILGMTVIIGFLAYSFNSALTEIATAACTHGSECPMWKTLSFQTNVSIVIIVLLFIVGAYIMLVDKDKKQAKTKPTNLLPDEKAVYDEVVSSEGAVFQSELTTKTGFTKVKITRVLDKLEGKGLVTRIRRGMTNVIILKD